MHHRFFSLLLSLCLVTGPLSALAQESASSSPAAEPVRVNMQNGMPVVGDFIIGPSRVLLSIPPGGERTVELQLTNRQGRRAAFDLTAEDFAADPDREGTPMFYERSLQGPYPAREWIEPEVDRLELEHGERAFIRVTIRVPESAEAGDHQAALIVTRDVKSQPSGGFTIVSRVAALFIITVEGDVVQEGYVDKLDVEHFLNWFFPVTLRLAARNLGTTHMAPTGTVELRNVFGIVVDEIPVRDWVVLRGSSRTRAMPWHPKFALGYYRASTDLAIFDGRALEPVSTSFWVIPIVPVLILLTLIFLVSYLVQYFFSRFEIKKKTE